jgi:hypothetical protein
MSQQIQIQERTEREQAPLKEPNIARFQPNTKQETQE